MKPFRIMTEFRQQGDQPRAILELTEQLRQGRRHNVMLGVTGSGKTFTMANIIANLGKPALIIAPNKTLAGQLYNEFKLLFPENAVEYFVSYYDYYQPEAYIPSSDTYIAKDSAINEVIDKLRHGATRSVLSRNDVIVVSSVSCIYGLGAPEDYLDMRLVLHTGQEVERNTILRRLVENQYGRNDADFHRGVFRVRGDRVEVFPAYEEDRALRIEFFGDEIEALAVIDPLRGQVLETLEQTAIFPASHYVTSKINMERAVKDITDELALRVDEFRAARKLVEAQRIEERTRYDLEMMLEMGYCPGIENYSRHLTGREAGQPPPTLLDYFPEDFVVFIDESHIGVSQIQGMYRGDRSRKETLVAHGFRLPSALDNRPLQFAEFRERVPRFVYVSATPADYELEKAAGSVVELIVRPTGLVDPEISVRPAAHQVDDLYDEIQAVTAGGDRILVTTLTKRMAEDLTEYYQDLGLRIRYLHADITTLERMEIIKDLRSGEFDVLVGINLLREGLDIPEVALVAILDADKEGFLRSERSLIQTCGRAARNVRGRVIMYADHITPSMKRAMEETARRRNIQREFNEAHGIVPASVQKEMKGDLDRLFQSADPPPLPMVAEDLAEYGDPEKLASLIERLEAEMKQAASELDFEHAAVLRDRIKELREISLL